MTYIVATIRKWIAAPHAVGGQRQTIEVVAVPEKKWDIGNLELGSTITSLWSESGANTKDEAIACVIENAIRSGATTSCLRPVRRDREYLLDVLNEIIKATRNEGQGQTTEADSVKRACAILEDALDALSDSAPGGHPDLITARGAIVNARNVLQPQVSTGDTVVQSVALIAREAVINAEAMRHEGGPDESH
jgi:hypothetical protein